MKKNRHTEMLDYYILLNNTLSDFEKKVGTEFENFMTKTKAPAKKNVHDLLFQTGLLLFERPTFSARFMSYKEEEKKESILKLERFLTRLKIALPSRPKILATWLDKD